MQATSPLTVQAADLDRSRAAVLAKRLFDVIVSSLLLLCLSPVFLVCALAVRLDSPGPILFRQRRIGELGKPFTMLKFRSMYAGSDASVHREFVSRFIAGGVERQNGEEGAVYKLVGDPRITWAGRWLRRSSLDELPQLWTVLRGDMSLVGPRPPLPYEVKLYQPLHLLRLSVKPGITGLWQVSGRSSTTFEEMVALDLEYIRTQSLGLDLRILLKTIPVILLRRNGH